MIRIERGEDINALRGMIEAGLISQDDLSKMTITGGLVSSRPQQFQGSRNGEEMQGQQQAKQPARKLRVIGYGNGQVTDLGEEDWKAPPLDYTRGGIEIAGVGKGHYSADGRAAYVQTPQGMTKVILGYDADASDRRNDAALKREMTRLQIEQEGLQNEGLRHRNEMLAAGPQQTMTDAPQNMIPSQKQLEAMYGKPDPGMRWKADGSGLEPIPGGLVQQQTQTGLEKAQDAITQVDDLLKHGAFEDAVGVSFKKALGAGFIPGTGVSDFNARLDQLRGGAFLEAFQTLKGGGQITEVEGKKATDAITRMRTSQSEEEFKAAALEFKTILQRGVDRAMQRGARPTAQAAQEPPSGPPKVGEVRRGWLFNGGDPSDQSNWKKVGR